MTWTLLSMSQSWAEQNDTKPYLFYEADEGKAVMKAELDHGVEMYRNLGPEYGPERAVYTRMFDTYEEALMYAFAETVESGAIGRTMEQLNVDPTMMEVYTEAEL